MVCRLATVLGRLWVDSLEVVNLLGFALLILSGKWGNGKLLAGLDGSELVVTEALSLNSCIM